MRCWVVLAGRRRRGICSESIRRQHGIDGLAFREPVYVNGGLKIPMHPHVAIRDTGHIQARGG